MKIETVSIEKITPNKWNPNEMDQDIYKALVESIKRHGVLQPILISNELSLIKGEKRWRAAREAGVQELICVIVETREEEAKLLNVSLNTLHGQTNEDKMVALIDDLAEHFSLEDMSIQTSYDNESLQEMIDHLHTDYDQVVEEDHFDVQQALVEMEESETNYGDVWQLGRHLLICGDATNQEDVLRLLDGNKADLVVTDPPYNVAVESESKRLSNNGVSTILNDDMSEKEFNGFLKKLFKSYALIMNEEAAIYVFHSSSYQREFENAMNAAGIVSRSQCIWVKHSPTFGWSQYRYQHEPVFYAHLKGQSPSWYGDRKQTTVWRAGLPVEEAEPATVWEISRGDVLKYVHPTQKPLELLAIPIRNSSKPNDSVVDLFGGSGSTMMTCEQMNRTCLTMELDPKFCDVIKKRFQEATGIEPVLISSVNKSA